MSEASFGARWLSTDGTSVEDLTVRWDNGGWTAEGRIAGLDIHYVIRLTAAWEATQFLLFRDLEEPDLWLATDRFGRWGEVNGAQRDDLTGCTDLHLQATPFSNSVPIRRLGLAIGESADILVARIDTETLGIVPMTDRYTRLAERSWRFRRVAEELELDFETDENGLVRDHPAGFVRTG